MDITRILVTTDLSHSARRAYPHAMAIAKRFEAEVLLMHVNEAAGFGFSSSKELVAFLDAVGARIGKQLDEERAAFAELGLTPTVFEEVGTPSQEILKTAVREKVDLIVLTRRGHSPARHFMPGSTARRVLRHAHVPVLMVPVEEGTEGEYEGYHLILTTTDFSEDSDHGLAACIDFAEHFGSEVLLTHVLRLPTLAPTLPGEPAILFPAQSADAIQEHFKRELAEARSDYADDKVRHALTIGAGDTAEAIVEMARNEGADLIVVPSHGKGAIRAVLFGSTSEELLRTADRPVMVFPRDFLSGD